MKKVQQRITTAAVMGLMLATSLVQASEKQTYPQSNLGVNAIESVAYSGMGCPQGSIGQSFANDRQSLTLIFDQFVASTGVGVPEDEEVKECRIDLTMQTPDSVQITMQTRGYTMLADGMSSDQHQNVLRAKKANLVTSFSGPVSKDYVAESTATVLAQGRPSSYMVTILLQVEVDKGNNTADNGQLTIDSFDLRIN